MVEVLPIALQSAQEEACADHVIRAIWPVLMPHDVLRLDKADADFLLRVGGLPSSLKQRVIEDLQQAVSRALQTSLPNNPHTRGKRLQRLIRDELRCGWDAVRCRIDEVFEKQGTDKLAQPQEVRRRVIQRLCDKCIDECAGGIAGDDNEAKRHLKIVTALTTCPGQGWQRDEMIRRLQDGSTRSYPYVVKYLTRGHLPQVHRFDDDSAPTTAGFTAELLQLLPDAMNIRSALNGYTAQRGLLRRFIDPDERIPDSMPDIHETFRRLPEYVQYKAGAPLMPKREALSRYRQDRVRMPDGVVCAVALVSLVEWVMRQVAHKLGLGGSGSERGPELFKRIRGKLQLTLCTENHLCMLFDDRTLSVRDALCHGAFFADDPTLLSKTIAGLTWALEHMVHDLRRLGHYGRVLASPRWDQSSALTGEVNRTINEQFQPGLNLTDQMPRGIEDLRHVSRVMRSLIPDKSPLGNPVILLWLDDWDGSKGNEQGHFVALVGGLIVLEELLRAVCEVYRVPVLCVTPEPADRIRFELAMLGTEPRMLLEEGTLRRIFGQQCDIEGFRRSINAAESIRNKVMHAEWQALSGPKLPYAHLIIKIIHTLCGCVGVPQ